MISGILRRAAALAMLVAVAVVYIRLSKMPFQGGNQNARLAVNVVMKNVAVAMRDGTVLRADGWRPEMPMRAHWHLPDARRPTQHGILGQV